MVGRPEERCVPGAVAGMGDDAHAVHRIRKSAYGRSKLFLPTQNAIVREVKCMGGVAQYENACLYHVLPALLARPDVGCWHCCEPVGDCAIPIPRLYDSVDEVYHVYGATCSPGCCKAYIMEHTSFDRGNHLNVLVRMLREVYGVTSPVMQTPPRAALRRFGGDFDPCAAVTTRCLLTEPPFVSYCMLVSESQAEVMTSLSFPAQEEPDTLQEPAPPGLFDAFVETHEPCPVVRPKRRGPPQAPVAASVSTTPPATGPLAKFMRK